MKKLLSLTIVTALFVTVGCTSTVTLGPKANESTVLGASASTEEASITLPLVRGSIGATATEEKKKKR